MRLDSGKKFISIPGPSAVPDRVLNAMHRASPNIYEGELIDLWYSVIPDLRDLAGTKHSVATYIGNGHNAWEAALENCVPKGGKLLAVGTGRFALMWGAWAKSYGYEIEEIDFGMQGHVDPNHIVDRLKEDEAHEIKAVLTVQSDTASSVRNDIAALGKALNEIDHPALFCVDCIASLGTEPHYMDDWCVDVMISASQKGLMNPAGLCFVFFNEHAQEARKSLGTVSLNRDWVTRANAEMFYHNFGGTAPSQNIYGLRCALDMIKDEGLENVWARHERLANGIWAAIDAWGESGNIFCNIPKPTNRSHAVTCITARDKAGDKIRNWCEENAGVTLGIGLGMSNPGDPDHGDHFRIGHMGHVNLPMVMGTLGAIDTALKAQNISHGTGALEAASKVFSA